MVTFAIFPTRLALDLTGKSSQKDKNISTSNSQLGTWIMEILHSTFKSKSTHFFSSLKWSFLNSSETHFPSFKVSVIQVLISRGRSLTLLTALKLILVTGQMPGWGWWCWWTLHGKASGGSRWNCFKPWWLFRLTFPFRPLQLIGIKNWHIVFPLGMYLLIFHQRGL